MPFTRNSNGFVARAGGSRPRPLQRALVVLALCVAGVLAEAQDEDPGHFEVRSANVELRSGVYFLNAYIEYRLSAESREALEAGVPLTFRIDVEIEHARRFWFDNTIAPLRQRYQLEFHALSERYLVYNLNSGEQASFSTLFSALNHLGRVQDLPLIDAALLDEERDYTVLLRAVLDVERLAGPLRLLAFWRRDWSLASEWYEWPLAED